MKRHILVGSVLLLFGAVITDGVDLAGVPFCEKSQNGIATYREGELVVRFASARASYSQGHDVGLYRARCCCSQGIRWCS